MLSLFSRSAGGGADYCRKIVSTFDLKEYKIFKCSQCGLEYTDPMPSQAELKYFYNTYHDIRADQTVVRKNSKTNIEFLKKKFGFNANRDALLDFGCGNGEFVDEIRKISSLCNSYGVDKKYSEVTVPLNFIYSDFEYLPISNFTFITMWGVLEHLVDPLAICRSLVKKINSKGFFVITTVNAEGDIPYWYKPPEHLTYWTREAFGYLARELGMEIVYYDKYSMQQFFGVYLDRLLARTPNGQAELIKQYLLKANNRIFEEIVTIPTNEVLVVMQKKK